MSFTTRCPACGTLFRVVADQLKISDGWVRCGHCADVFDATVNLQAWVPAPPAGRAAAGAPAPAPVPVPVPASAPAASTAQRDESAIDTHAPEGEPDPWGLDAPMPAPVPAPAPIAAPPFTPATAEAPAVVGNPAAEPAPAAAPVPAAIDPDFASELQRFASAQSRAPAPAVTTVVAPPGLVAASAGDLTDAPAPLATPLPAASAAAPASAPVEPGFMRQARRRAFWSSRGVQAGLVLATVALAGTLAAQWAVHERHRLMAAQPGLRPWLQQACDVLGCSIAPPRRIEAIVIESSELVRRLGNFYSFDLVVRNTAPIELAVPALELSLTDGRDAVVARRVFLPQEWPGAPAQLPANGTLTVSFRLSLSLGESAPMAGYRALVFYP